MPVVLDGLRARLGQVGDLVRVPDPDITGPGQVPAAPAGTLREVRDGAVRVIVPRQVRPAAPGCLPGLRFFPPCCCLRCGGFLPGWSSLLGGIEELPLLREISRSSRAICSACSAS
jgi:hypothetical protein